MSGTLVDLREAVAKITVVSESSSSNNGNVSETDYPFLKVEPWLTDREQVYRVKRDAANNRTLYHLETCPVHTDPDGHSYECCVMQRDSGKMEAKCQHSDEYHWQEFKQAIGPPGAKHYKGNGTATMSPGKKGAKNAQDVARDTLYLVENGCIGYMKPVDRGQSVFSPLCNFNARITEEVSHDNGVEIIKTFVLTGQLVGGRQLPSIEVPVDRFSSMNWVMPGWGVRARLSAGLAIKDRPRAALQCLSQDTVALRTIYTHTGWRKVEDKWVFLHAGGAIGDTQAKVALERPLDRFVLPNCPEDVADSISLSLSLLEVAPANVTIPLLASIVLAPLCEILHPDFALWLFGSTGSMKSTLCALFLSHCGDFPEKTALPATWESTENALEKRLFTLKDLPYVVDDYAPKSDPTAQNKMQRVAQHTIRGQGNLSGRARMKADTSLRPDLLPRGLLVSTGEELPPGESILARMVSVEVIRDDINIQLLTEAQKKASRLPHAMSGYIAWLAPQMDRLKTVLRQQWSEKRDQASLDAPHLRLPEMVAYLATGLDYYLKFAVEVGAVAEDHADRIFSDGWDTLLAVAKEHGKRVKETDPAERFMSVLASLIASGGVRLELKDLQTLPQDGNKSQGEMVGWMDSDYFYLLPEAVRQSVTKALRDSGEHFPHSPQSLYKALLKKEALIPTSDGRNVAQFKIHGVNRRVLHMPRQSMEEFGGESI